MGTRNANSASCCPRCKAWAYATSHGAGIMLLSSSKITMGSAMPFTTSPGNWKLMFAASLKAPLTRSRPSTSLSLCEDGSASRNDCSSTNGLPCSLGTVVIARSISVFTVGCRSTLSSTVRAMSGLIFTKSFSTGTVGMWARAPLTSPLLILSIIGANAAYSASSSALAYTAPSGSGISAPSSFRIEI